MPHRMVATFILLLIPMGASADTWEFTPGLPCVLTHETADANVKLTYDPGAPLYTISITRDAPFTPAPIFSITFNGPNPLTISTDRHEMSDSNRRLTVSDTGFGNVLNGLQFNFTATAQLGDQTVTISLAEAAAPVAAFRECRPQAGA